MLRRPTSTCSANYLLQSQSAEQSAEIHRFIFIEMVIPRLLLHWRFQCLKDPIIRSYRYVYDDFA